MERNEEVGEFAAKSNSYKVNFYQLMTTATHKESEPLK